MEVLLAADDAVLRAGLEPALRARGWTVVPAASAADAWVEYRTRVFPLVILAAGRPQSDLAEVCRRIRSSPGGGAVYLLVVTDGSTGLAVAELAAAGVDDCIFRPHSAAEVEARLAIAEERLRARSDPQGERPERPHSQAASLQETLEIRTAYLEKLFESAPEGIAVMDSENRIIRINPEFTRLFGYTRREALGREIDALLAPGPLNDEARGLTHSVMRGEQAALDTVRRRKDGRDIQVSVLAVPIRFARGQLGAYGIYRDITERKLAEQALRESEHRYRALFTQSPVGVFQYDRELRITDCNERLLEILNTTADPLVGMDLRNLRDQRVMPGVMEAIHGRTATYRGPYETTTTGEHLWISARLSPLRSSSGEVIGGIGVLEDITQQVEAEARLQEQARELERVNAELSERTREVEEAAAVRSRLYTAMNHELRTPISAIVLYNDMLLSGALGPLSEVQLESIDNAQRSAQHLLELVQDLLDLSKLEAGKLSIHLEEVKLPQLIEELFSTARPLAARYGSELRLVATDSGPVVTTDPRRLRQILLNLLSNAAKFGRSRPITIRCTGLASGGAAVEVIDEGRGIAPADLPRIFEDFVQVADVYDGGTGLGLAISRRLAEMLGGSLEVDSEPEVGSTFRLLLPRRPSRRARAQSESYS